MKEMTAQEKRDRVINIVEQIGKLNTELDNLLGTKSTKNEGASTPSDFNQTEAIRNIIIESKHGIQKKQIIKAIKTQHGVDLKPEQVQNTLSYLKNTKKEIQSGGYGRYKAIQ